MELLHFDPVNVLIVIVGIIAAWVTLKKDSNWHTEWIKKHGAECDEREKLTTKILGELQTSNTHLSTLATSHHERIGRIETQMDKQL